VGTQVDRQYAAFKVEPKCDERNDANFPPHLHAGFQLFCMTKNFNQVPTSTAFERPCGPTPFCACSRRAAWNITLSSAP
jgi:hypothetical protein